MFCVFIGQFRDSVRDSVVAEITGPYEWMTHLHSFLVN